jgi:transcriptional regulator with XRE-family HTH domain
VTGSEIAEVRKSLGLSQVEFAQLFDAHHMTVSKWERGVLSPSPYQVALMHEFHKAAEAERAKVQQEVKNLLVGAGVIAAIFWLLTTAKK